MPDDAADLEGSVAGRGVLVAGATGALGGLIARELTRRGVPLAVSGRDGARLGAPADELRAAAAIAADLTGPGEPERVVGAAADALGGTLAGMVCAIGVVAFGPVRDLGDETLRTLVEVNLMAPLRLTRAAAAHMRRGAVVVNVSAIVAELPTAGMAAYSASKAGLTAFDAAGGRELGREGIRVVDLRPPHLATGLETRPIAGEPPRLREGEDPGGWARRVADELAGDAASP